jgi:hypothetical protein
MKRSKVAIVLVLGITVGLVAGGAFAWAAIPNSSTGVISGCYRTKTGKGLRVIDAQSGKTCARTETALSWNQTGPQGSPGVTGTPGSDGGFGTFYAALTMGFSTSGCPADQVRLVVGRHWGAPLALTGNACTAFGDPHNIGNSAFYLDATVSPQQDAPDLFVSGQPRSGISFLYGAASGTFAHQGPTAGLIQPPACTFTEFGSVECVFKPVTGSQLPTGVTSFESGPAVWWQLPTGG